MKRASASEALWPGCGRYCYCAGLAAASAGAAAGSAAFAIAAALYQRDRLPREQQRGQYIDVAMLDCGMSLTSQLAGPLLTGGIKPRRRANLSINFEPTADVYKTADGAVRIPEVLRPYLGGLEAIEPA